MRFDRIRLRGLGPFADLDLDLASLPGTLTAVVGENGAGKSTLLELLGGTVFRTCPTRGSLRDLATERGAWSEVEIVSGAPWTVRQVVDPVSNKGEAVILDAGGRPVLDSGKVRDADAWVRAHLPPAEVLYASTLGVQGSEGFLAMKPGDRKAVLLRILGVEQLEALAARAREHARDTKQALAVLDARLADERHRGGDVAVLRDALERRREALLKAEVQLSEARAGLERAREVESANARRRELEDRLAPLEARERALRATLDRAAKIRAAAEDLAQVRTELAQSEGAAREATDAASQLRGELDRRRAEFRRLREQAGSADRRAAEVRRRLAARAEVDAAVRSLPGAREDVESAERAVEGARGHLERLRGARVVGAEDRVASLRDGLARVASGAEDPARVAYDTLAADDHSAELAAHLPVALASAERRRAEAEAQLEVHRRRVRDFERIAARAEALEHDEAQLAELEEERKAALLESNAIRDGAGQLIGERDAHEADAKEAQRRVDTLRARAAGLEGLASQARELDVAEVQLTEVRRQAADLEAQLEALPPHAAGDAVNWPQQVAEDERAARDAGRAAAAAERDLLQAETAAARSADLEAERATVAANLAEWNILAAALGRDGVQAALIDAAGPELTEMVNDLLRNALGPRWTGTIETTRLDSTGKRQLEGLDVRVIDTERGRDALVETYSGGERVLLGEAVSLALTMLACQRAGVQGPTIVRDESGAALDPERARQWVSMVRRAAELIGASRVLLVSHVPEVADLCDSRLVVADGRVEVC